MRKKEYNSSSDSLTNEINSTFPISLIPDFSDSVIYFRKTKDKNSPIFRYYQITQQFQNQLNGYRYCWNNPLRYTDPTGQVLDPITATMFWQLAMELGLGIRISALLYKMYINLEPGYGYDFNFGIFSLWLYMDYEGNYHWPCIWDEELFGPQGWD